MLTDDRQIGETPGLFDQLNTNVANEIEGILSAVYQVPFAAPYPPVVVSSSRVMLLYKIFERRSLKGNRNPYYSANRDAREMLIDFAESKRALGAGNNPFSGSVQPSCLQFEGSPSGIGYGGCRNGF